MPDTIKIEDVVRFGGRLYQNAQYDNLGDLPNARSALDGGEVVASGHATGRLSVRLFLDAAGRFGIAWENADADRALFVRRGTIDITAEDGERLLHADVRLQPFPPLQSGSLFELQQTSAVYKGYYRVVLAFNRYAPASTLVDTSKTAIASSKVFTAFTYQQSPQDVCFVFPWTNTTLWASSKVLINHSAYCFALLSGKFSESTVHTSSETSDASDSEGYPECSLFEESDDETDMHFASTIAKKGPASDSNNLPHKKVVITQAAFTTYQATLVWMSSRYIRFAPLRSSRGDDTSESREARLQDIIKMVDANPETSLPASPKSVYRLAHLLELKDLQEAALANLSSQLTPRNAATELFSDVASAYPAFRDVVLKYVAKNWSGVRASEAWKRIKEQADGHTLPAGAAYTALLLSEGTR